MLLQREYLILLAAVLLFAVGGSLFRGVLDNYLAGELGVSKSGRGIVEFFREMPGLFLVFFLALLYRVPENLIMRLGFFIALIGVIGFFAVGSHVVLVILFLTVYSTGQHLVMPVQQSIALHSSRDNRSGSSIGLMRSVQSMGHVAGFLVVPLIFALMPTVQRSYAGTFLGVILLVAAALLVAFFLKRTDGQVQRQRIHFKKKYTAYYILQNFYGARKQVFLTFGPYLLILKYGASASVISTLLGITAAFSIFTTPLIGRLIDRIGYKKVMVGDTVILFFVSLVYGFSHRLFSLDTAYMVVCLVFLVDSLVSQASMAASVYVKELSENREELVSTLTTGLSLDHLISIVIALAGGFIWETLGVEMLFIVAALLAAGNSLVAAAVKAPGNV